MMWVVGLGMARGSRFRISAPSEIDRHIPKAAISDFLERVKSTIADCLLVGAAGDEIATAPFAPSPAAASDHDEVEISRRMLISATNVRRINADDELFAPISGKLRLKLASAIRLGPRAPSFLHHLIVEPLADPDGTLAHGRMRLSRFSGQEIGQHLRRLPVGQHAS